MSDNKGKMLSIPIGIPNEPERTTTNANERTTTNEPYRTGTSAPRRQLGSTLAALAVLALLLQLPGWDFGPLALASFFSRLHLAVL